MTRIARISQIIVWLALSLAFAAFLLFGRVEVDITRFFSTERSVRSVWQSFRNDLPDVGNETPLVGLYWICIAICLAGVPLLIWMATTPSSAELNKPAESRDNEA